MKAERDQLSTAEVARQAGIHKDTLLRWLRSGVVPEPGRDRHGWRLFTREQARSVTALAQSTLSGPQAADAKTSSTYIERLKAIDWDFTGAKTGYLTHGIHPYPAKFIPQIPNALIQELSSVGDTVADIFCGSGTTLVEALTLKRHAVGIDANPLACLMSRAKTTAISESDALALRQLATDLRAVGDALALGGDGQLFPTEKFVSSAWRPKGETLSFWFEPFVVEELAECLARCRCLLTESARMLALTSFSSIVVAVSKQDSDTRYVRREKGLSAGEVFRKFARALDVSVRAASEYSDLVEPRFRCAVVESTLLDAPQIPPIDLMVCSPPYPNAFSYHLYHMTRMLWLGMDQPRFKKEEIGSHRKYSSNGKNAATADTFRREFEGIMMWLRDKLKKNGYACFVVGDSTLKGERIDNAEIISQAGKVAGFSEVARIHRTLQSTKKSFNPSIGKIKTEKILILENCGGAS
ncbi:MerR family transcriptional regulator [Burkholderia sp. AU39826]|uniref:DNA methyltransferase n=1 Tax=Burkholderia sp. AU39826 TaxID=2879634 RepID=UPI001CF25F74|nr:DNA methyltransferase [Burkholderia sp. AU39826]MCA7974066.1 MerR family transcriptional regulator [Burkholderia sp. AU39826]